jgi:methoxymalonate biosynthesis acyl carrier protein
MEDTRERLRAFVGRRRNHIPGDDDPIFASGFVNSLFAMQLILFIEKEFHISVCREDLTPENFQTIAAVATLIRKKQS